MNALITPKLLFFLCVAILASLIAVSLNLIEVHVKESIVFYFYLAFPIIVFFSGIAFVQFGLTIMFFNDKFLKSDFLSRYFTRLCIVLGIAAILFSVVELFSVIPGYMPIFFAWGSGVLCSSYSRHKQQSEQVAASDS